jgi:glycolate oxidase iron-sulfur subunit
MDSPRGRIVLMKSVLEGSVEFNDAEKYLDQCLGCLGCVTSCPSGVEYGNLITPFRAIYQRNKKRRWVESFRDGIMRRTSTHPSRFRIAAKLGMLARPLKQLMPRSMRPMLDLLPDRLPKKVLLPEVSPATGQRKYRVALLAGCAQQVLAPEINLATIRVLNRHGCDVHVPRWQGCCGAVDWHDGYQDRAKKLAAKNFDSFGEDFDAIVINAAGCGSAIKEYGLLFAGDEKLASAQSFAKQAVDISVFLHGLGFQAPVGFDRPTRVAYQDACHLAHAQGVRSAPRELLASVPNLELVPIADADICCGSAGTYNVQQPEIAVELGRKKVEAILKSECEIVATGNIGCLMQMRKNLKEFNSKIRVCHMAELL